MVGSIVHQLTEGVTPEELEKADLGAYYTDHGVGLEYILKEFNKFWLKIKIIFKIIISF